MQLWEDKPILPPEKAAIVEAQYGWPDVCDAGYHFPVQRDEVTELDALLFYVCVKEDIAEVISSLGGIIEFAKEARRYSDWLVQPGLPEEVTLWRGGVGDERQIRNGMSWTTDQRVARHFANYRRQFPDVTGSPSVVLERVPRRRILIATAWDVEAEYVIDLSE